MKSPSMTIFTLLTCMFMATLYPVCLTRSHTGNDHNTIGAQTVNHLHRYIAESKDPVDRAKRITDVKSILQHKLVHAMWNRFPTRFHFAEFLHSVVKDEKSGISWTCQIEVIRTLEALIVGNMWVFEMLDSWGKPGPGLLRLNGFFRGDYKQCNQVKPVHKFSVDTLDTTDNSNSSAYQRLLASFPSNRKSGSKYTPSQARIIDDGFSTSHENLRPINDEENSHAKEFNQSSLLWQSEQSSHDNLSNDEKEGMTDEMREFYNDISRLLSARIEMQEHSDSELLFKPKYCRVGATTTMFPLAYMEVPIIKVYIGATLDICVPEDCTASDLNTIVNTTIQAAMFGSNPGLFVSEETYCHERIHLESKTIGVLAFIVVGLGWLAFATAFDIWRIQRPRWKLQRLRENFTKKRADLLKSTVTVEANGHDGNGYTNNGHHGIINNIERSEEVGYDGLPASVWTAGARRVEDGRPNEGDGESLEDILFKPPPIKTGHRIIQFFSVYTNCSKILNTKVHPETLTTLHGVRFLSMCWIIVGHTLLIGLVSVANISEFMNEMKQKTWFLIISNGFLCVDTFFVLSGMMVGYFFRDIADHPSRFKWMVYVLHRFVRLTPAIMVTMAVYIGLWPYLSTGPGYPDRAPDEEMCKETWWYTLLYINNLLPVEKLCMMWTWYLSCDYQFYLVCTVFMIPLHKGYKKFGIVVAIAFALASMITSGVISYTYHIAEMLPQFVTTHGFSHPRMYYNNFYQKPYCRIGPYVVGLLLGYILQKTKRNIKMPLWLVLIGWVVSTVVALTTLLGIHESWAGHHLMSDLQIAVYNATKHTAFGLSVAWVLFACLTGHGGYINTILTWKPFIPLSRLTYCTYLVHPVVIYLYFFSQDGPVWLNIYNLGFHSLAIMMVSVVIGCGLSVFVESPTIQLEREVLIRLGFLPPQNT